MFVLPDFHIMRNVDVIVPVYKGLEETRSCVESYIRSCSTYEWSDLIVINDFSPDPELTRWLRKAADKYGFTLLENDSNLGFVATVNRGMAINPAHDVLLLNSDVEVSGNWLERIREAAYSRKVGSITPFSNNATICSFPGFCLDNELFLGFNLEELDTYFSSLALDDNLIEIPTGIGFCMYLRRDCLDEVGYFNVETFGKGYGEENDWSQRALKAGWPNYHQLNVFVYHKGGVSFQDEINPRKKNALNALRILHPNYDTDIVTFIETDPAQNVRIQAVIDLVTSTKRSKVLYISHGLGGGVLENMLEIAEYFHKESCYFLLEPVPELDEYELRLKYISGESQQVELLRVKSAKQIEMLLLLLQQIGFSLLHFHHVMGNPDFIVQVPKILSCDYIITLHDYYYINGNPTLTDFEGRFVGDVPERIDCVISEKYKRKNGISAPTWRDSFRDFLQKASLLIMPSCDVAERYGKYFDCTKASVAYHLDNKRLTNKQQKTFSIKGTTLKVLVIGALSQEKGADLLEETAVLLQNESIEFHLLGYAYRPLDKCVVQHGKYDHSNYKSLIAKINPDVVWFPAVWPETYSYTLSMAFGEALPVVAPDLGAFPERLAGYDQSCLIPWDLSPEQLSRYWKTVRSEGQLFNNVSCLSKKICDGVDFDFYQKTYRNFLQTSNSSPDSSMIQMILQKYFPVSKPWAAGSRQSNGTPYTGSLLEKSIDKIRIVKSGLNQLMNPLRQIWRYKISAQGTLCVDSVSLINNNLTVKGWGYSGAAYQTIEVSINGSSLGMAEVGKKRPDVFQANKWGLNSENVGFVFFTELAVDSYTDSGSNLLTIKSKDVRGKIQDFTHKIVLFNEELQLTKCNSFNSRIDISGVAKTCDRVESIVLKRGGIECASFDPSDCCHISDSRHKSVNKHNCISFDLTYPLHANNESRRSDLLELHIQLQGGRRICLDKEIPLWIDDQLIIEKVINLGTYTVVEGKLFSHKPLTQLILKDDEGNWQEALTHLRSFEKSESSKAYLNSNRNSFIAFLPNHSNNNNNLDLVSSIRHLEMKSLFQDGTSCGLSDMFLVYNSANIVGQIFEFFGTTCFFSQMDCREGCLYFTWFVFKQDMLDIINAKDKCLYILEIKLEDGTTLSYTPKKRFYSDFKHGVTGAIEWYDVELFLPDEAETVSLSVHNGVNAQVLFTKKLVKINTWDPK